MELLKYIIESEIRKALNEAKYSRILEKKSNNIKKGTGIDTIERANKKAYNSDVINGSELGRQSGIGNPNWSDDTLRSYISKLYGKGNKNPRKPSKKENEKFNSKVSTQL